MNFTYKPSDIGKFAMSGFDSIEPNIHPTAIIYPNVKLGVNVKIGAYAVIGGPPEHRDYFNKPYKSVVIEDNVWIGNHVTIDSGTERDTFIDRGSIILCHSQIGHDAKIGVCCTISCHAVIGGHSVIFSGTNIGIGAMIHQNVKVPPDCMIGMGTIVTKKTKMQPNSKYVGNPARYLSPNK